VLLTSSRRGGIECLPTGVHDFLDSRDRHTADRSDVVLAPFNNIEPDNAGEEDGAPQLPPLVLSQSFGEELDEYGYGWNNHRPMLAPPSMSERRISTVHAGKRQLSPDDLEPVTHPLEDPAVAQSFDDREAVAAV